MLGEGARTDEPTRSAIWNITWRRDQALAGRGGRGAAAGRARRHLDQALARCSRATRTLQRERVLRRAGAARRGRCASCAARADINLTIDAEESDRLELSLDVFEALAQRVAAEHPAVARLRPGACRPTRRARCELGRARGRKSRAHCGLRFMVRLVKGAYWDGEIKRAQELGLPAIRFSRTSTTPTSALPRLRARAAAGARRAIYPQFATPQRRHASRRSCCMARDAAVPFELQRLHGMGEGVYREVLGDSRACRAASMRRSASIAICSPTWCAGCSRTARTRRSCTSSPTRRCGVDELLVSPLRARSATGACRCRRDTLRRSRAATAPASTSLLRSERAPLLRCVSVDACRCAWSTVRRGAIAEAMRTLAAGFRRGTRTPVGRARRRCCVRAADALRSAHAANSARCW